MISEYRDHTFTSLPANSTDAALQLDNETKRRSYAETTSNTTYPKKDQAIIMEAVEGLTSLDYASAIGKITGTESIRFLSRISNGRVCHYLNSKQTVTNLTSKFQSIPINNQNVEVRPLINPAQRIILSNVSPTIPNETLENAFIRNQIQPVSKISFLRAGFHEPGFAHILSFRRQIYVERIIRSKTRRRRQDTLILYCIVRRNPIPNICNH